MSAPNDYLRRLADAADESGWIITRYDAIIQPGRPSELGLMDERGNEIVIATELGLDTEEYLRRLKALPRASVRK